MNTKNFSKARLFILISNKLKNSDSLIAICVKHAINTKQLYLTILDTLQQQAIDDTKIMTNLIGEELTNKLLCTKF